jgi:crossover junction endodeoxyribonuclease RuvC
LRICGIDPGLNITGYGVIDVGAGGRSAALIEAGVIRTSADAPLHGRLAELGEAMDGIMAERGPDLVAVEELYSHYRHPRTAILMGHARGVLLLSVARAGVEVVGLPSTQVKRTLTGNGHASKAQMQRAVMATLNLSQPPEPPDVADALAIALCAALRDRAASTSGQQRSTSGTVTNQESLSS